MGDEMKGDVEVEMKEDVKVDMNEEMKDEVKDEVKEDMKQEEKNDVKEAAKPNVKDDKKEKLKDTIGSLWVVAIFGMAALGVLAAFVGFILMLIYLPPYDCEDDYILKPGGQSSCNITKDWFESGSVEVEIDNETTTGAKLQTFVFNKEPTRIFVNETYKWDLEEDTGRTRYFYLPTIANTRYILSIDANEKVDIVYRYKSGKYYRVVFEVEDVKKYTCSFTSQRTNRDAYFMIKGSSSMKGKLEVIASWPRWTWEDKDYAFMCESYPCEFDLADPKLADQDLWFVTVNNGGDTYEVYTEAYYKEALRIPLCVGMFVGGIGLLILAAVGYVLFIFLFA